MSPIIYGGGGGGGVTPPARNVGQCELDFVGTNTNVGNVPLAFSDGDASMVNLTDPTYPNVVSPGIYAYTVVFGTNTGTGTLAKLLVDDNYYSIAEYATVSGSPAGPGLCVVWFCDAADPFRLSFSGDPAGAISGSVYVQKIA